MSIKFNHKCPNRLYCKKDLPSQVILTVPNICGIVAAGSYILTGSNGDYTYFGNAANGLPLLTIELGGTVNIFGGDPDGLNFSYDALGTIVFQAIYSLPYGLNGGGWQGRNCTGPTTFYLSRCPFLEGNAPCLPPVSISVNI